MQIPFLPLEKPLDTFGKSLTLTTRRVIGPTFGRDRSVGSILLENVVFCSVTKRSPPFSVAVVGAVLMLIGLVAANHGVDVAILRFSTEQTGVLGFLTGLALLLWYLANRKSTLVVNSANGSVCEVITAVGLSAEEFISQIQTQQCVRIRETQHQF